jgi:hypothetical protein
MDGNMWMESYWWINDGTNLCQLVAPHQTSFRGCSYNIQVLRATRSRFQNNHEHSLRALVSSPPNSSSPSTTLLTDPQAPQRPDLKCFPSLRGSAEKTLAELQ